MITLDPPPPSHVEEPRFEMPPEEENDLSLIPKSMIKPTQPESPEPAVSEFQIPSGQKPAPIKNAGTGSMDCRAASGNSKQVSIVICMINEGYEGFGGKAGDILLLATNESPEKTKGKRMRLENTTYLATRSPQAAARKIILEYKWEAGKYTQPFLMKGLTKDQQLGWRYWSREIYKVAWYESE